jgi:hypothetical protein
VHRRALPDLGAEKGMSTMNMSRWAKRHGIPLRERGGPSHTANIDAAKAADNAHVLLRTVLAQIGGAERLARFAATVAYPSVTAAASAIGLCQPSLARPNRPIGSRTRRLTADPSRTWPPYDADRLGHARTAGLQ